MDFLIHLAKSSLFLVLFYACYRALFGQTTFFRLNRAYLLMAMTASLLLPLIERSVEVEVVAPTDIQSMGLPADYAEKAKSDQETPLSPGSTVRAIAQKLIQAEVLVALYAAGVLFFLALLLGKIARLRRLTSHYSGSGKKNIMILPDGGLPGVSSFSFLNRIFMTKSDFEHHFEKVYRHEKIHVDQKHSLDLLLTEFLGILLWFNPVISLYRKSLQEVHEFLADASADDKESYARFLVSYALHGASPPFPANTFSNPDTLKNRILMLYKKRDSRYVLARYLAVLPIVALTVMLTASTRLTHRPDSSPAPHMPTPPDYAQGASETQLVSDKPSLSSSLARDEIKIRGIVFDASDDRPLSGAVIVSKNNSHGTTTNANGEFEFVIPSVPHEVVVSFVGFGSRTVTVKDDSRLSIALEKVKNQLDELVVFGYGIQKKAADTAAEVIAVDRNNSPVFTAVETMPEFPGGEAEMYKYLARNIRYPAEAMEARAQGKVHISFIINKRGRIRNPKVIRSLGYGTDEEALRVVISMPGWKPGMQNGQPVDTEYTLPVSFKLMDSEEVDKQGSTSPHKDQRSGEKEAFSKGATIELKGSPNLSSESPSLFILNGEELKITSIDTLDANSIQSIEVRKGEGIVKEYGEKAKNGVVLISTKKEK